MTSAPANRTCQRSAESRAFEAVWRSLRSDNLMPMRDDFHPGKARNLISDLVLVEAPDRTGGALRIRVTGGRFNDLVGTDLTGLNPHDLLPRAHRAGAVESTRLIFEL